MTLRMITKCNLHLDSKAYLLLILIMSLLSPVAALGQEIVQESLQKEEIQRIEAQMILKKNLDDAYKLASANELAQAKQKFKQVLELVKRSPHNSAIASEAKKGIVSVIIREAEIAERNGENLKVRALMEEALVLDPTNTELQKRAKLAKRAALTASEKYPESRIDLEGLEQKISNIRKLLEEGDNFIKTGQFSRAQGAYNKILRIDPYNKVALNRLEEIDKKEYIAASWRKDAFRQGALADVSKAWNMKPKIQTDQNRVIETTVFEPSNVTKIYDKLETIKIPEFNFTEVDISEVVKFLQMQSKALDPEGEGINFVLKSVPTTLGEEEGADATDEPITVTMDVRNLPIIKVLDFIKSLTELNYKVEEHAVFIFPANETSDVKVVRSFSVPPTFFSTKVTSTKSSSAIGADEVKIVGADVKAELEQKGVKFTAGTSAAYLPKTSKLVVRNTLEQISIIEQLVSEVSGDTTQVLIEAKFIEFTEDELKDFSSNFRISADSNVPGAFIDSVGNALPFVPPIDNDQVSLNGLTTPDGFPDYGNGSNSLFGKVQAGAGTRLRNSRGLVGNNIDVLLGLGTSRNPAEIGFTGVLGGSGFRYLLSALESTIGSDLMSAPKVTLVNGQKSKVRIVREFYYPTEYEVPELVENQSNGNDNDTGIPVAIPSTPTDFESRDIGVILEVQANATPDRRIDLELKPEVVEFEGFIDYGSDINLTTTTTITTTSTVAGIIGAPITTLGTDSESITGLLTEANNLRPVFSNRSVQTKLQVIDGQTVVMAGFIRDDEQEINDKVPFFGDLPLVGRAFRSKVTQSIKKNLIIFVTARMVNPDGTPKFLTETEADELGINQANN